MHKCQDKYIWVWSMGVLEYLLINYFMKILILFLMEIYKNLSKNYFFSNKKFINFLFLFLKSRLLRYLLTIFHFSFLLKTLVNITLFQNILRFNI